MLNARIVDNAITKKISDELLMDIVYEAFINGLPLDQSTMDETDIHGLKRYTWDVTQAIGGIKALEAAVDFENKTPAHNLYLGQIYAICTEGAITAKSRSDTADKDPNLTLKTVVDRAALTENDYKTFVKDKGKLNLDKVSDIIKKKTIAVIKDEQEQYDKEKELDTELNDALSEGKEDMEEEARQDPTPDFTEDKNEVSVAETKDLEANEASKLLNLTLEKDAPRHHVSVFSRMQDDAAEMIYNWKVANEGDYFPFVNELTFNYFLPSIGYAAESARKIANEEVCEVPQQNRAGMTNLVSIIVYTMMETLKTMGLINPSPAGIRSFVNKSIDSNECVAREAAEVYSEINNILKDTSRMDFSKMESRDLMDEVMRIKNAQEAMESAKGIDEVSVDNLNLSLELGKQLTAIESVLDQRVIDARGSVADESFNTRRQKGADIAQFNRIEGMFGKNELISSINLRVDPNVSSVINVECATEGGNIIRRSFMNMQYACESSKYIDYLKDAFNNSKMKDTKKKVSITVNDGRGKRIACNY